MGDDKKEAVSGDNKVVSKAEVEKSTTNTTATKTEEKEKELGFWDLVTFAPEIFPGSGITYEHWRQNFEYEVRRRKEKTEEKAHKKAEAEVLKNS